MDEKSPNIALENDVLHAAKKNFPLFYNREFDLGSQLQTSVSAKATKDSQISLSGMNISTKNMTPPINQTKPSRSFLFIKK